MVSQSFPIGNERNVQLQESFFLLGALYMVWRALLDFSYAWFLYPRNAYFGFEFAVSPVRLLESHLLMIAFVWIAPRYSRLPSTFLIHAFLLVAVAPLLTYFAWSNVPQSHLLVFALGVLVLVGTSRFVRPLVLGARVLGGASTGTAICAAIVTFALCSLVMRGGLGNLNIDLTRVYEFRSEGTAALYSGWWTYLYTWAGGSMNMILLAIALHRRSYWLAAVLLVVQLFFFAASSNRIFLFLPFMVLASYFVAGFRRPVVFMGLGLILFAIGIPLILVALDFAFVADLFVRRTLFVPAFLSFVYIEFFEQFDLVLMSNSILGFASEYPYGRMGSGFVIGNYLGFPEGNSVTGFLPSAYMHFGAVGVVVFAFFSGLILRAIDGCYCSGLDRRLVIAAAIGPVRTLFTESDFVTSLVTHGLLLTLLVLILYSSDGSRFRTGIGEAVKRAS